MVGVRAAGEQDWPAIWPIVRRVVAEGETYTYDRDLPEPRARELWLAPPPARAFVAVDEAGAVVGTAKAGPNHGGGGSHVATASFMVHPDGAGRGVGRALGEHVLDWARQQGYRAVQFNAVVESNRRAVALWRSLGFQVLATVPAAFDSPTRGLVGLHVMHRRL